MRGWKMRRCAPEVRPRRTFPERCSAAEPCPGSSTTSAAQRLVTALRQDGSALRAEFLRWTPDTLPLRSRVPGTCRGATLWVPGTCRGAALRVPGTCREPDFGVRGRAAEPDFGVPGRAAERHFGIRLCSLRLKMRGGRVFPHLPDTHPLSVVPGLTRDPWPAGSAFCGSRSWLSAARLAGDGAEALAREETAKKHALRPYFPAPGNWNAPGRRVGLRRMQCRDRAGRDHRLPNERGDVHDQYSPRGDRHGAGEAQAVLAAPLFPGRHRHHHRRAAGAFLSGDRRGDEAARGRLHQADQDDHRARSSSAPSSSASPAWRI